MPVEYTSIGGARNVSLTSAVNARFETNPVEQRPRQRVIVSASHTTVAKGVDIHFNHTKVCPRTGYCETRAALHTAIDSIEAQRNLKTIHGKRWSAIRLAALNTEKKRFKQALKDYVRIAYAERNRYKTTAEQSALSAKVGPSFMCYCLTLTCVVGDLVQ